MNPLKQLVAAMAMAFAPRPKDLPEPTATSLVYQPKGDMHYRIEDPLSDDITFYQGPEVGEDDNTPAMKRPDKIEFNLTTMIDPKPQSVKMCNLDVYYMEVPGNMRMPLPYEISAAVGAMVANEISDRLNGISGLERESAAREQRAALEGSQCQHVADYKFDELVRKRRY